ncbi:formate dehydrogenase accessory sulfurtransferase FdhD [Chloroflexota bacterium]
MTDQPGAHPYTYWTYQQGQITPTNGGVVAEARLSIFINAQEIATIMCSPTEQKALALGFLHNEGMIHSLAEVKLMQSNVPGTTVDIFLDRSDFTPPRRLVLTSGCSGGVSFQDWQAHYPALTSAFTTTPETIFALMRAMQGTADLYRRVRGVHAAALGNPGGLLLSAEDIGRHNTIDKVAGKALLGGVATRDQILTTSGRISSEMLIKARMMDIPIVASHTSPTSVTVQLAELWDICVAGYVRQDKMRIYTHPERLGFAASPSQ